MYNRFAKSTKQKNLFNSHIAKTKDNPKNNIQNLDHFIGHATETYDDLLDYLKEFDGLLFEEQQFVINLLKESAVSATKFNIVKDPKSSNGITRIRKTELKKFLLDPAQYDKIVSYILDILKRASEIGKSEIIVDSMMRLFKGLDRSSVENIYLSLVGTWANQKIINKLEVDSEAIKILQKAKVVTGGSKGVYKIDSSILQLKYVQDYISVLFEHHMTTNRHIIMKSKFDFIFGANHDISKKYKDDYTNNIAPTLENRLEDAEKSFNLKDPINFGLAIYALDSSSSIARNFEYEGLISGIEYKAKELGIDLTDQVKIRQVFDEVLLTKKRGSDTLIFLEIEGDTQMYRIETKSYFDAVLKSSTTSTHSRLIGTASQSGTKLDLFVKYQIDFKNIIEHINSRGMTEEEAVKRIQLLTNDIRDIGDMIPFYNKLQVDLANINRDKNSILLPFVMIRKIDSKANIYNINEIGPLEIQLISELLHNSNEEILEMIENPISIFNVFKANTIQFESLLNKIGINNIPTDDIKFIDFMRSKVGFIKQLSFSDPHMFDVNSNGKNILLEKLRISSYNIPKDLTQNSINEIDSIFGKISFNDGKSYANANYIDIILNNKYQVIDDPNIPNIIPLPTGSAINLQMYVTRSQDDISVKNTIDKIESAYSHSSISPIFVEDRTIIDSKSRTSSAMNNLFNIHVARTYLGGEKGFSIPVLLSVPNKDPLRVYIFIPVQGGLDYTGNIYYRTKEDIREIFESELYGSPNGEFLIVGFNKITVRTITGRERLTDSRTLSSRTEVKNNIKMFERNTDSLFSFGKSTRGKVKQTNLNIEGTPLNQAQSLPPNHREVLRIADDLTDQGYHLFGRANAGLILESMMKTKKTITFGTYHGQIHIEHIEELIWIHVDTLKRDGISVSHIDEVDYKNLAEQLFLANRVHHARNTYKVWKRDSAGNIILDHEIRVIGMPKSIRGNSKIERLINYFAYNKGRNAPINSRLGDKFVDSAINNPVYRLLEKAMGIDLGIRPADRFSILFEGMVISYIEFASVKNDGVNPRQISDTIKYAHNYWSDIFDINIPGSIRLNLEKYTEILDYINYLSVIHLLSKIDSSAFLPESVRRDLSLISSSYPMYKTLTSKILEKYLLFD